MGESATAPALEERAVKAEPSGLAVEVLVPGAASSKREARVAKLLGAMVEISEREAPPAEIQGVAAAARAPARGAQLPEATAAAPEARAGQLQAGASAAAATQEPVRVAQTLGATAGAPGRQAQALAGTADKQAPRVPRGQSS